MQEDNAIHFLNLAITAFPEEGHLYAERSELLHAVGRNKEALADQNRAIALNPKDDVAYFARAQVEVDLGDLRAAAEDFGTSAKYDIDPWRGYSNKAKCYEQLKDYRAAIAALTELLTSSKAKYLPELLNARLYRAKNYIKLGDLKSAFEDLNTVINTPHKEEMKFETHNQMSAQCGALQERAGLFIKQKKLDAAIKDYTKLIAIDQQWGQSTKRYYEERAKLFRQTGQLAAAKQDEALAKKLSERAH
ncbi:MAG: tetratricopeptide repeat protein, partial [Cyanobacteria bacterium SZAS LIN-3]|nr:tetratricopeptide repeat protein [Cyanobacteria bacterium SZAS LIN-3]